MKAVVGVDLSGAWAPAVDLLCRIWPTNLEVELVHCIESVFPDRSFPDFGKEHPLTILFEEHKRQGEEALAEAQKVLVGRGVPTTKHISIGEPSRALMNHADDHLCDMIVVRSSVKGFWGTTLFGSTAKGVLVGAHQSVLVVKTDSVPNGAVNAVLATDHSRYINQCVERLLAMNPSGIADLVVYTANEIDSGVAALLVRSLPKIAHEAPIWIMEKLVQMNEDLAKRLSPICKSSAVLVRDASPNDGIQAVMKETKAELLIMGAQGHGFIERLNLGSKSFHQALSEPFSVLVLRTTVRD